MALAGRSTTLHTTMLGSELGRACVGRLLQTRCMSACVSHADVMLYVVLTMCRKLWAWA